MRRRERGHDDELGVGGGWIIVRVGQQATDACESRHARGLKRAKSYRHLEHACFKCL